MRKLIVALMLCAVVLNLCGCSSSHSGVPDEIVQLDVAEELEGENYGVAIHHEVDKSAHLDYVSVDVEVNIGFGKEIYIGTAEYIYNRSNDNWNICSGYDWEYVTTEYDKSAFVGVYEGEGFSSGADYYVKVTDIDFVNREIIGSFYVSDSKLYLSGYEEYIELDTTGTYRFSMDDDGFDVKILDSDYEYYFSFSKYYGLTDVWSNYVD